MHLHSQLRKLHKYNLLPKLTRETVSTSSEAY